MFYATRIFYISVILNYIATLFPVVAIENGICKGGSQHVVGSWKLESLDDKSNGQKSFHCCYWDGNQYLHDTRLCGNEAENNMTHINFEQNLLIAQPHTNHYSLMGGGACTCDAQLKSSYKVTKREQYTWEPSDCKFYDWDSKTFCSLLGKNRTILFVGDSTAMQTGGTLQNLIISGGGDCVQQVQIGRSEYLVQELQVRDSLDYFLHQFNETHSKLPEIVVLTAGAHARVPEQFYKMWSHLKATIPAFRARVGAFAPTFVWKTQNPGHSHCHEAEQGSEPSSVFNSSDQNTYNYNLFEEWDAVSRTNAKSLNMPILDMAPLYFRPDAHPASVVPQSPDCLHYCVPGPLDIVGPILITMLYNKEI